MHIKTHNYNNTMEHEIFHNKTLSSEAFRRIGSGFCGSVWADPNDSSPTAIKREDGGPGRSLLNDSQVHKKLIKSLSRCPNGLRTFKVPEWYDFVASSYEGWQDGKLLARFPANYSSCNILLTQRIPPMPEKVRHLLIETYCPSPLKSSIKEDKNNEDCLLRPYLGRRRRGHSKNSRFQGFSLRNYPLHMDQMEEIQLDVLEYAQRMAHALAFMHWSAQIDAKDIEFVLAPPGDAAPSRKISSPVLGDHNIWILDFDCCRPISMDFDGLEQARHAFWKNDPFYPRPGREDERDSKLWSSFRAEFISASSQIIGPDDELRSHLPEKLMDMVEADHSTI
ncbi:zinc finger protein-domain-containing protein [Xylariaceae sp. FL0804]|nr:zinc finger protein-domain-containing protein [Xylariaceae sp. FL0804]